MPSGGREGRTHTQANHRVYQVCSIVVIDVAIARFSSALNTPRPHHRHMVGRARHDDQLGVLRHPHEEPLVDPQLIELAVDEPERHVDAVQRGEQVEHREAPQRDVLRVQRVAAGAEVRARLVGQDAIEHAVREPHAAVGQRIESAGEDAVGVEPETAGDRGAGRGDEPRDGRRVLRADVLDAQQPAHRMADEQHGTAGRGIPHRFVDGRERATRA